MRLAWVVHERRPKALGVTALVCMVAGALLTGSIGVARADGRDVPRATPVMGWSSWSFLRKHPTEAAVERQAAALHASGLQAVGYTYVNLDDFWYSCPGPQGPDVDRYGRWQVNAQAFPSHGGQNGIATLAAYVHKLGLKFGIYETPGISKQAVERNTRIEGTNYTARQIAEPSIEEDNYNCGGMVAIDFDKPGAQAYINSIVKRYAKWGVDFIKLDGVTNGNVDGIKAWSRAIARSGRPMILDITDGTFTTAIGGTLQRYANEWEPAPDVECYACERNGSSFPLTSWRNVRDRFDFAAGWQRLAEPGHFNDFDSVDIGNGSRDGLTVDERRSVLSLWALGASPLILGSDLTHLTSMDLAMLKNRSVIEVDQDSIAAKRVVWSSPVQVFAKKQRNGDVIFGFFNTTAKSQTSTTLASILGLPPSSSSYLVKNLWTHRGQKFQGPVIRVTVPAHGVRLYAWKAGSQ